MKIRTKLLLFLLVITLVPLLISAVLHRVSMRKLSRDLAHGQRERMLNDARDALDVLVNDYHELLHRDRALLELAIRIQAREIERRLAEPPPPNAPVFTSRDFETEGRGPDDLAPSETHYRLLDGTRRPINISWKHQVGFVPEGVAPEAAAPLMARTATMPSVYRLLRQTMPQVMLWQYTGFEAGLITIYPGHGGLPKDYDPRRRPWYKQAREAGDLVWTLPIVDASTRELTLTVAAPVRGPDGAVAGVTAIDVPLQSFFRGLRLPPEWEPHSERILAGFFEEKDPAFQGKLVALVQKAAQSKRRPWDQDGEPEYLTSEDREAFAAMLADIRAGRPGSRQMRYHGRPSMWCYSGRMGQTLLPLLIVPYEAVTSWADTAEKRMQAEFRVWAIITGLDVALVIALVVVLAFRSSRSVTRPIRRLTDAGKRLASGDYTAQVRLRSDDEFQELGEAFNNIGPKLAEHDEMKQSLALAMEIQQHLLPQGVPSVQGFEIAGNSLYCDETGGDYYDFIELNGLGPERLGIAVGDVTGHGVGSALLMASARAVLRSHATLHGNNLAELFDVLNVRLVRDTGDARFMTLFYGVLNGMTKTLSWVSGGHDPAHWVHADTGKIEELTNTGMALGVIEETEYEQAGPIPLARGDVVVIGTDGIWEAHNAAHESFGKERLREVLSRNRGRSAREIYEAVVEAVRAFEAGSEQEDDLTLVVIKAL